MVGRLQGNPAASFERPRPGIRDTLAAPMSSKKALVPFARILLPGVLVLVTVVAGATAVASILLGREVVRSSLEDRLEARSLAWSQVQQQRFRQLELIARSLAGDEVLLEYLADPIALLDTLEQYQNHLVFDFALILDADGEVLARRGADGEDELATSWPDDDEVSTGIHRVRGRLWHVVSVPLVRDYQRLGRLVVGLAVDETFLGQVRAPGIEVFVRSGTGEILGGSSDPSAYSERLAFLDAGLVEAAGRAPASTPDGRTWFRLTPVRQIDGTLDLAVVHIARAEPLERPFVRIALVAVVAGVVALVLGILGSWGISRRIEVPLRRLEVALAAEQPDLDAIEGPGVLGELGEAIRRRFHSDETRDALVGRVRRAVEGRAPVVALQNPHLDKRVVLLLGVVVDQMVEARHVDDSEAAREDAARSLGVLAEAVEVRGGRWSGPLGPRWFGVFEEDEFAAVLGAGAEIATRLGDGGGEGPRIGFVRGSALVGSLRGPSGELPILAGSLTKRLDALLREANPGEIVFSDLERRSLAPFLDDAGVEPEERRGLLATRPFRALSPEAALQVAQERRGPTSRPMLRFIDRRWLELRWELLGESGRSDWGHRLKARDRETGRIVRIDLLDRRWEEQLEAREVLEGVARRIRDLRSLHVAPLLHVGTIEGRLALVAPWVEGASLATLLEGDDTPQPAEVVQLALDLAKGLVALHERGVVHGGVVADRAVVDLEGRARWIDAGLVAALISHDPEATIGRPPGQEDDLRAFGRILEKLGARHSALEEVGAGLSGVAGGRGQGLAVQMVQALEEIVAAGG